MQESDDSNLLFIVWDCNGIEDCINVTEKEKEALFNTLKGGNNLARDLCQIMNYSLMRARYNSQRHYEIYTVRVDRSIDAKDMIKMFEENQQGMADLIRKRGKKIFSDRAPASPAIV